MKLLPYEIQTLFERILKRNISGILFYNKRNFKLLISNAFTICSLFSNSPNTHTDIMQQRHTRIQSANIRQ